MIQVQLSTDEWRTHAFLARSFVDRLLGTFRAPQGGAVMLKTRSVHTFGQQRPLSIVGLDEEMKVISVQSVAPNRMVLIPSARMILEVPEGDPLPAVSSTIGVDVA